jgi:hypothetical protein
MIHAEIASQLKKESVPLFLIRGSCKFVFVIEDCLLPLSEEGTALAMRKSLFRKMQ